MHTQNKPITPQSTYWATLLQHLVNGSCIHIRNIQSYGSVLCPMILALTSILWIAVQGRRKQLQSGHDQAMAPGVGVCQCWRYGAKRRANLVSARRACVARGVWGHAPPGKFYNFPTPEVLSEAISEVFIYAASCWQISVHQVVTRGLKVWEDSKVSESLLTHCC